MKLEQDDIDYPRDLFHALIDGNSPYAFYLFQWVPYQTDAKQWRLKMLHDVKTFDGREEYGIWPNGGSCGSFKDSEVEFIRISRTQLGYTYQDPRDVKEIPVVIPPSIEDIVITGTATNTLAFGVTAAEEKRQRKAAKRLKGKTT